MVGALSTARGGRRTEVAVFLALLAVLPATRRALLRGLRWILTVLATRSARLGRPAVRKDFLSEQWQGSSTASALTDVGTAGSFEDFGNALPPWLLEGLQNQGFKALKPIQQKVLPLALAGKDVVGLAPTGSGKTLAFLVPAAVHAAGQPSPGRLKDGPIVLILAPTRELAVQIGVVADRCLWPSQQRGKGGGKGGSRGEGPSLTTATLYGGTRKMDQLQQLRNQRKVHIMVATPGRLLDLVKNDDAFNLRLVSFFVLDEGDRMLDFGFEEDIAAISSEIRSDRQMLFFSATWPKEVELSAKRLCCKGCLPDIVHADPSMDAAAGESAGSRPLPPRDITQLIDIVDTTDVGWGGSTQKKLPLLMKHLEGALGERGAQKGKALVFVSTRAAAEDIGSAVAQYFGLDRCGVMHGARSQDQRESTLRDFRNGRIRALVATDVVGRGVDIPGVTHVVIFDFPGELETYIHRVGRTGRNGAKGTSIAFFEPQPWNGHLAQELCQILEDCGQEVPDALRLEVELAAASRSSWGGGNSWSGGGNSSSWSGNSWSGGNSWSKTQEPETAWSATSKATLPDSTARLAPPTPAPTRPPPPTRAPPMAAASTTAQ